MTTSSQQWGFTSVGTFLMMIIPVMISLLHAFIDTNQLKWIGRWLLGVTSGFLLMTMLSQLFIDNRELDSDDWEITLCFLFGYVMSLASMNTHQNTETATLDKVFVDGGAYDERVVEPSVYRDGVWVRGMVINEVFRNFCNGLAVASAFLPCSDNMGWLVTVAVLVSEIPLKISHQWNLVQRHVSKWEALGFNLLTSAVMIVGWLTVNLSVVIAPDDVNPELILALATGSIVYTCTQYLSGVLSRLSMTHKTIQASLFLIGGIPPAITIARSSLVGC